MRIKLTVAIVLVVIALLMLTNFLQFEGNVAKKTPQVYESPLFRYEITHYPAEVEISPLDDINPDVGINTDTSTITFGIIPNGGSYGTRYINMSNEQGVRTKIKLESSGTISPMISFENNNFLFGPNEKKAIPITLRTTDSTVPGNYTGEIIITTILPKNSFADALLGWL